MFARTAHTLPQLLTGLLPALAGIALFLGGVTHDAPQGGWVGSATDVAARYDTEPSWPTWEPAMADTHPGCEPIQEGALYGTVLVVTLHGDTRRMDSNTAWRRATNNEWADDVWTLGGCQ